MLVNSSVAWKGTDPPTLLQRTRGGVFVKTECRQRRTMRTCSVGSQGGAPPDAAAAAPRSGGDSGIALGAGGDLPLTDVSAHDGDRMRILHLAQRRVDRRRSTKGNVFRFSTLTGSS